MHPRRKVESPTNPELEAELRGRALNRVRARLIVHRFDPEYIRRCLDEHDREFNTLRKTERPDIADLLYIRIAGVNSIDPLLFPSDEGPRSAPYA